MAEAVQELYPGTQVTIGPVIENGFYYDFARNEPFTPEDLPAIEAKMREIVGANAPFTKEVWSRDKARQVFRDKGEAFKVELIDAIPEGQDLKIYRQGDWFDLCRGPHMASTGQIGNAFKLMKVAGAYWRGDSHNPMLTRIYGTAWRNEERARRLSHTCSRRPRSATIAGSAARWTSSISRRRGRASSSGTPRAGRCSRQLIAYMRRRLKARLSTRSTRRSCSTSRCGRRRATGAGSARTCSWRARPATRPTTSASSRSSR